MPPLALLNIFLHLVIVNLLNFSAALHENYDKGSFHGKKSFIYRASSKRTRPTILVVANEPQPNSLPLEPREPVPTYENLVVEYRREDESLNVYEKVTDEKKPLPPRPNVSMNLLILFGMALFTYPSVMTYTIFFGFLFEAVPLTRLDWERKELLDGQ